MQVIGRNANAQVPNAAITPGRQLKGVLVFMYLGSTLISGKLGAETPCLFAGVFAAGATKQHSGTLKLCKCLL